MLFLGTVSPTEKKTVVDAPLEGEGTQNQVWALWKDKKIMAEVTIRIAGGGQQEAGRPAPVTLRMGGLRATQKERSPERAPAVHWTDIARDSSVTLMWELGQARGCCGDPTLMLRGFHRKREGQNCGVIIWMRWKEGVT